jgi:hypothetical protein
VTTDEWTAAALKECLRIVGECTAERQPNYELLKTVQALILFHHEKGQAGSMEHRLELLEASVTSLESVLALKGVSLKRIDGLLPKDRKR